MCSLVFAFLFVSLRKSSCRLRPCPEGLGLSGSRDVDRPARRRDPQQKRNPLDLDPDDFTFGSLMVLKDFHVPSHRFPEDSSSAKFQDLLSDLLRSQNEVASVLKRYTYKS